MISPSLGCAVCFLTSSLLDKLVRKVTLLSILFCQWCAAIHIGTFLKFQCLSADFVQLLRTQLYDS